MTSYQKLKKDLAIMVFYSGSIAAQEVSEKYRHKKGFYNRVWLGEKRSDNYLKGGVIKPETIHKLSPVMRTTADGVNNFLYGRTSMPEKKAKYAEYKKGESWGDKM